MVDDELKTYFLEFNKGPELSLEPDELEDVDVLHERTRLGGGRPRSGGGRSVVVAWWSRGRRSSCPGT